MQWQQSEKISVLYHNVFNYPLSQAELIRWQAGPKAIFKHQPLNIKHQAGLYFLEGRNGLIYTRFKNKRSSNKKVKIAKKASGLIASVPTVKFIGVTGSLAMGNATQMSDIDLLIITKKGFLWTTRLVVYGLLKIAGYKLRIPKQKNQKDRLCLNIWLDEGDLSWPVKDRNIYTAHEIAQIIPLINKNKTYERFLWKNKWLLDFWPNSVRIREKKDRVKNSGLSLLSSFFNFLERLAYRLQYQYMKQKITREVVTPTRAIFHPNDLGKKVLTKLGVFG